MELINIEFFKVRINKDKQVIEVEDYITKDYTQEPPIREITWNLEKQEFIGVSTVDYETALALALKGHSLWEAGLLN